MEFRMIFTDEIIDEVRNANDIVQVVGEYVKLEKRGQNYFGICPFHKEKTGSFHVYEDTGHYICFGCNTSV
jgi:DNA primase